MEKPEKNYEKMWEKLFDKVMDAYAPTVEPALWHILNDYEMGVHDALDQILVWIGELEDEYEN